MALRGRRVGFIVALAVVALSGLVWLQVALLRYAMEIKEQAFRNNVQTALASVSQSLATGEVMTMAYNVDALHDGRTMRVMAVVESNGAEGVKSQHSWWTQEQTSESEEPPSPVRIEADRIIYTVAVPQHVMLSVVSADSELDSTLVDRFHSQGEYVVPLEPATFSEGSFVWRFQSDSANQVIRWENVQHDTVVTLADSGKRQLATEVMQRLFAAEQAPMQERLDSINVDSILGATLGAAGIDMDYAYGVVSEVNDSLVLSRPAGFEEAVKSSDLKTRLFPQDVFAAPTSLRIHFPERETYLWAQIAPLVTAEVVFMLIIIACFAYTIRTILRQKRFSRLLVDFINNMTHEFKTPISTVALASEAIARPDILAQKDKVLQFNDMIKSEIGRMRNQAEKILQMATLEEQDIAISWDPVNLHEVIRSVVEGASLQVEHHGGSIRCDLAAKDVAIDGDKIHLTNVISNVIDNAVKYSTDAPQIEVATQDAPEGVQISVSDSGLGMTADEARQVFQKYYRVPTGDRHDVKGFGLGLSYVKLMVEAHGGTVSLKSKPGEGTRVELYFRHTRQRDLRG
jgi:two-component system phosphate regulon sensor histidine kinase PhoR